MRPHRWITAGAAAALPLVLAGCTSATTGTPAAAPPAISTTAPATTAATPVEIVPGLFLASSELKALKGEFAKCAPDIGYCWSVGKVTEDVVTQIRATLADKPAIADEAAALNSGLDEVSAAAKKVIAACASGAPKDPCLATVEPATAALVAMIDELGGDQ